MENKVVKKLTTHFRIVVDEITNKSEDSKRAFLARVFEYPELLATKETTKIVVTDPDPGITWPYEISDKMLSILKNKGFDVSTLDGYKIESIVRHEHSLYNITRRIAEIVDIKSSNIEYHRAGSEENTVGLTTHYIQLEIESSGPDIKEVKKTHRKNVTKLKDYLKKKGVLSSISCDQSSIESHACEV